MIGEITFKPEDLEVMLATVLSRLFTVPITSDDIKIHPDTHDKDGEFFGIVVSFHIPDKAELLRDNATNQPSNP